MILINAKAVILILRKSIFVGCCTRWDCTKC